MKSKTFLSVIAAAFVAAMGIAAYLYFKPVAKATDREPQFTGTATQFAALAPEFPVGAPVRIQGSILSAESKSVELDGGLFASKDSTDLAQWPSSGAVEFIGYYNGIEIDDFLGDTLIRLNGCFLLESSQPQDLH